MSSTPPSENPYASPQPEVRQPRAVNFLEQRLRTRRAFSIATLGGMLTSAYLALCAFMGWSFLYSVHLTRTDHPLHDERIWQLIFMLAFFYVIPTIATWVWIWHAKYRRRRMVLIIAAVLSLPGIITAPFAAIALYVLSRDDVWNSFDDSQPQGTTTSQQESAP